MDNLVQLASIFDSTVNGYFGFILDNPFASNLLRLFLLMYSGLAAPNLHPSLLGYFDNYIFRVLILVLVLWTSSVAPTVSIVLVMIFIGSLNRMNSKGIFELFGGLLRRDYARDAAYYRKSAKKSKKKQDRRKRFQFASGEQDIVF